MVDSLLLRTRRVGHVGFEPGYVESTNGKLELHFLPGYAPELNPDELVWNYVKRTGTAKSPLTSGESLGERIEADLQAVQDNPSLVRSFFKAPCVAYILD